jgi:hypothetical protein
MAQVIDDAEAAGVITAAEASGRRKRLGPTTDASADRRTTRRTDLS